MSPGTSLSPDLRSSFSSSCLHLNAQTQSTSNDCFIDEARVYSFTQACNLHRPNQLQSGGGAPERWWEVDPSNIYRRLNNGELGCWLKKRRGAIFVISRPILERVSKMRQMQYNIPLISLYWFDTSMQVWGLRREHLSDFIIPALAASSSTSIQFLI